MLKWVEENRSHVLVINICRQFGKSLAMLAYCIAYCISHPRVHVIYLAPSRDQVKRIIMPNINTVFSYLPDDLVPAKMKEHWTFVHNGSTFQLNGCNVQGGTRLRGTPADLVVIDECRDVSELEDIIDSSITPMFTTTNGRLILISTPPESPLHPFTDKYIREAINGGYYYTTTYKTNPLLKTDYLRHLLTVLYPGGEANPRFRREYMADYGVADPEKRVVREWNPEENDAWFETYAGPPSTVRPYTFLDYGYTDPCGIIFGYFDWQETVLVIEDEFFKSQCVADDVGRAVKEKERLVFDRLPGKVEPIRIMDIDPALQRDLWERHQLRFRSVNKAMNDYAMINKLRTSFTEQRIRIHRRCENLRFQLQAGVWNKSRTDYLKTERGGHLDLLAALKYGNMSIDWKEIFATGAPRGIAQNQIVIQRSPFKHGTFGGGVLQRPV